MTSPVFRSAMPYSAAHFTQKICNIKNGNPQKGSIYPENIKLFIKTSNKYIFPLEGYANEYSIPLILIDIIF